MFPPLFLCVEGVREAIMYLGTLAGPTTKEGTGAFPVNTLARLNQIFMFSYHYLVPIPSPPSLPFLFILFRRHRPLLSHGAATSATVITNWGTPVAARPTLRSRYCRQP